MISHAEQLENPPMPHLADALRSRLSAIVANWALVVREKMPQLELVTFDEIRVSLPAVLEAIASVLASHDLTPASQVLARGRASRMRRPLSSQSLLELFQEERLLREVIVPEIERELNRRLQPEETSALHGAIDVIVQQSILELVDRQREQIREAAENEVKFIAFLSQDLSNHLLVISLSLELIADQLEKTPEGRSALERIDAARHAIQRSTSGMRQLMERERLRQASGQLKRSTVDLRSLLQSVVEQFGSTTAARGIDVVIVEPPHAAMNATIETDPELLGLVVHNLIENAAKHSREGRVRVSLEHEARRREGTWRIAVIGHGPGMSPERRARIQQALASGDAFGKEGIGLRLAIAGQAAHMLGGTLEIHSGHGQGTMFSLTLPR